MAGGMRPGPGRPLQDRTGPLTPVPDPAPATPAVGPPPGTPCWIDAPPPHTPGVVLGWQQADDGQWHALVSAWLPKTSITPRR